MGLCYSSIVITSRGKKRSGSLSCFCKIAECTQCSACATGSVCATASVRVYQMMSVSALSDRTGALA